MLHILRGLPIWAGVKTKIPSPVWALGNVWYTALWWFSPWPPGISPIHALNSIQPNTWGTPSAGLWSSLPMPSSLILSSTNSHCFSFPELWSLSPELWDCWTLASPSHSDSCFETAIRSNYRAHIICFPLHSYHKPMLPVVQCSEAVAECISLFF